ncbi:MAG: hypothetical protein NTW30_00950, partial [Candidatus Aenigmarchaeota archaeon]|nr:hypothetical protein [Candidatus Aenigmarchaeota archaeon]
EQLTDGGSTLAAQVGELQGTLDGLITEMNGMLELTGATLDDFKIPIDLVDELQIDKANFKTAINQYFSDTNSNLPEIIDFLKQRGMIDDPSLVSTIEGKIDEFGNVIEPAINIQQQEIIAKLERNAKWSPRFAKLGTAIQITSIIGDVLIGIGSSMVGYGIYLDNAEVIFWGNMVFTAGLATEYIVSGISIGAMILVYALGWAAISASAIFSGFITGQVIGLIVAVLAVIIANAIFCFLNQGSPYCGCSISPYPPYNGKPKLELDRNVVVNGDILRFTTHGMQYCYPSDFFGFKIDVPSILHYHEGIFFRSVNDLQKRCYFDEGFCCEGSIKVNMGQGSYDVAGYVGTPSSQSDPFGETDALRLTVIGCNPGSKTATDGLCHEGCGADYECGWSSPGFTRGYPDNAKPVWSGAGTISANQIRNCDDCSYKVTYDSYIDEVSVNGYIDSDATVNENENIEVIVKVNNTGTTLQTSWFVGLEFYNVSDYNNPWGTRDYIKGRINAFYNGTDGTHGCVLDPDPLVAPHGYCPYGVDCQILSESGKVNGILDVNEQIVLKCIAPASFYGPTSIYSKIMFWVHERELTQDATNDGDPDGDGNVGDWWVDALAVSFRPNIDDPINGGPASVRVNIVDCNLDRTGTNGICYKECGASPECDEKDPGTTWYEDVDGDGNLDTKNTCDSNCEFSSMMLYCQILLEKIGTLATCDDPNYLYDPKVDANKDLSIDGSDFFFLLQAWSKTCDDPDYNPRYDFNKDGV